MFRLIVLSALVAVSLATILPAAYVSHVAAVPAVHTSSHQTRSEWSVGGGKYILPAAAPIVAPAYAAYSAPLLAHHAPIVAGHAPIVAGHAPLLAGHAPLVAGHAPIVASAPLLAGHHAAPLLLRRK